MSAMVKVFDNINWQNNSYFDGVYQEILTEVVPTWIWHLEYIPWVWAIFGSLLVGLSGVLPLLVIPEDMEKKTNHKTSKEEGGGHSSSLKTLLSFAVGGLLGDVFLHSLPEIWANDISKNGGHGLSSGILILTGLIIFVMAEKIFTVIGQISEEPSSVSKHENNNVKNYKKDNGDSKKHIAGYLNLLANSMDNFTHGLSLGGAFLISMRSGVLTTFAILVHEIPHEVGDFAILLKSGFTRWEAALFQLLTAGGGLIGSIAALIFSGAANSMEARTSWILPFTAGTFLHIALVTVLPDLLKEENPKESFKQLLALIAGISVMAFVAVYVE